MAINPNLNPAQQSVVNSAIGAFKTMFAPTPSAIVPATPAEQSIRRDAETQAMFDIKQNILAQVRLHTPQGERPTLEQYRLTCVEFAQTNLGKIMNADPLHPKWTPASFADLSGQDLSGFTITEPKKAQQQAHHLDPKPELEIDDEQTHGHRVTADYDGHDRDGDGAINVAAQHPFYDNIRFDKADLHGAFVEPATSFNEEIAKAGNLKDMTFNGMSEGDVFTFRPGVHENARMTNIDGGEIVFASNTQVHGVSIEGTAAKITIGDNVSIEHINVSDEFRIIKLEMGKNSIISNSDLGQSTVSMSSHFEPGAKFDNVQLSGNLSGLNFSGLKLHNVSIDGDPISHPSQLTEYGITHDEHTKTSTTSSLLAQQVGITGIGAALLNSEKQIGNQLNDHEKAALQVTQGQRTARLQEQAHSLHHLSPPLKGNHS